jgi:hypothetical protein
MRYNNVYPFTKEELEKLGINFKLWELCKYQQNIIDTYKEYIEKQIHQKITEETFKQPSFKQPSIDFNQYSVFRHITIPETRMAVCCDPWVHKNWEILQAENPVITPEYFISLAYREMEEKKNVDSN